MKSFLIPVNFSPKNQEHVQILQQALIALGYATNSSFSDCEYDNDLKGITQSFKTDNALPTTNNMTAETIKLLNSQLEELYRVFGELTDDYGMPIEGAEVIVYENKYTGVGEIIGTGKSLSDGTFRVYLTIPNDALGKKNGLLKNKMSIIVEIKQNDIVKCTEDNLFIQDKENIFNFSSAAFTYQGNSIYQSLKEILSTHDLAMELTLNETENTYIDPLGSDPDPLESDPDPLGGGLDPLGGGLDSLSTNVSATPLVFKTELLSSTANELLNMSRITGIEMETMMKIFFAEVLEEKAAQPFNGKDCIFNNIDAETFFAFIYQNIPVNLPQTLFNEEMLQYSNNEWSDYLNKIAEQVNIGLTLMPQDALQGALLTACKTYIIDFHDDTWINNNVDSIMSKKNDVAMNSLLLEGEITLSDIINAANTNLSSSQKEEIALLFITYINNFNAFIDTLNEEENRNAYESQNIDKIILAFQLSQITRNFLPLINAINTAHQNNFNQYGIRFIATINLDEWLTLIDNNYPSDFETAEQYAQFVYDNAQKLYPEIAAISQIANTQSLSGNFQYTQQIKEVLLANNEHDILINRIEEFTMDPSLQNNTDFMDEFRAVQRVHRISPSPEVTTVLLDNKIVNATQVYFMGKEKFTDTFKEQLSQSEINNVYDMATARYANALIAFTNLNNAFNGNNPYALPQYDIQTYIENLQADIPNIAELFGNQDHCECDHDSSVYGPGAYLADLLLFLDEQKNEQKKSILDLLKERREDICKIILDKQNTQTMLPYIDLVCEVLEEATLKSVESTFKRLDETCQSNLTTEELLAAPEHILKSTTKGTAYDVLKRSMYPMYAPINLEQMESRAYLSKMGIARHDLMEAFGKDIDNITDTNIAVEYFGLTNLEQLVITALSKQNDGYDLEERNEAWNKTLGTEEIPIAIPVTDFMQDTGLSAYNVLDITAVNWIGLTNDPITEDCSLKNKFIESSPTGFDRAHRFIRLWRKSDWKMWELNLLLLNSTIANYGNGDPDNLNGIALHNLFLFSKQQKTLGLSCEKLIAFYGKINAYNMYENGKITTCLYDKLFLNTAVENPLNANLAFIKNNPTAYIDPNGKDDELIAACLSTGKEDYDLLKSLYPKAKDIDYLSYLYRHITFAKKLQVSIPELLTILKMRGKDITKLYSIGEVNEIIATVKLIKESKISIFEYEYLTQYGYGINSVSEQAKEYALTDEQLKEYVKILHDEIYQKPIAQKLCPIESSTEEESEEDPEETFEEINSTEEVRRMNFITRPSSSDVVEAESSSETTTHEASTAYKSYFSDALATISRYNDSAVRQKFNNYIEGKTDKNTGNVSFEAAFYAPKMSDNQLFERKANEGLSADDICNRYNHVIDYLIYESEPAIAIQNHIAKFFDLSTDIVQTYLRHHLNNNETLLDHLLDISGQNYKFNLTGVGKETVPINIYKILILLHKASIVMKKNDITTYQFTQLLTMQDKLKFNWFAFKTDDTKRSLPLSATENLPLLTLQESTNLNNIITLHKLYGPIDEKIVPNRSQQETLAIRSAFRNTLLDLLSCNINQIETNIPSDSFIFNLCKITKWNATDFKTLIGSNGFDFKYCDFYKSSSYAKIQCCMEMLNRMKVPATTILGTPNNPGWRKRETNANKEITQNAAIKAALKSKYDVNTWLKELATIQKPIREAKADALSSYLIAVSRRNPNPDAKPIQDKLDLYNIFLLDPEMTADMKTSRIVQATCAIQLFMQRIFLNLENVDKISLTEDKWKQWEWMKRYRLWEANFKVFLYPENFIEPELRDDKSPFFKEMEDELNQSDITEEHVENVFVNYLQKLHEVSNLTVIGLYNEVRDNNTILHVVGRSRSTPYQYFYRNYNHASKVWSHWEKIELDIKGDVVVPIVYKRKLHLFWINTMEKTFNNSTSKDDQKPSIHYTEIQLGWSVLKNKKWTAVRYSKKKLVQNGHQSVMNYSLVAQCVDNEIVFRIHRYWGEDKDTSTVLLLGYYYFNGDAYRSISNIRDYSGTQNEDKQKCFDNITTKMDYDEKPETELTEKNICFWINKQTFRSSRLFPMVNSNIYLHNYLSAQSGKFGVKLLDTKNKNPNLAQAIHGEDGMWMSMYCTHFKGMIYQDSKRSFFIKAKYLSSWNWEYSFHPFYHPYTNLFIEELSRKGIAGLLNRDLQLLKEPSFLPSNFNDEYTLGNESGYLKAVFPEGTIDTIDFDSSGAYAPYNWELFFHAPLYIACKLSQNQKHEEAMKWFHYIFNPTDKSNEEAPQKFWITKPFFKAGNPNDWQDQIKNMLTEVKEKASAVQEWLNNPFNPHLVARTRTTAFQKTVVMKYINNLIGWADQLFRQDTMESNNEATLLYILAYEILGKRPITLPAEGLNASVLKSYEKIAGDGDIYAFLDDFDLYFNYYYNKKVRTTALPPSIFSTQSSNGNGLSSSQANPIGKTLGGEGIEGSSTMIMVQQHEVEAPHVTDPMALLAPRINPKAFCVPFNETLLHYWDTVEDRLFKLRHCMNIDGIVRDLPLFAPPIDPAMLVKAAAAGLSIADALNEINAQQPYYRFRIILQKAIEFTGEVKQLGEKLLAALEKKDAEVLSLLRSSQEINMQQAMKQVRKLQIDEAKQNIVALEETIKNTEARKEYYGSREYMNTKEKNAYNLGVTANVLSTVGSQLSALAAGLSLIPQFDVGVSGVFATPVAKIIFGGQQISAAVNSAAISMSGVANTLDKSAALLSTQAGYERRKEEWDFQAKMANLEINQLIKQLLAAKIRLIIAEKELENMELQIEQSQSVNEYYKDKFTNEQLYNWMITEISKVYLDAYTLAYDMAKKAELCFRKELGIYGVDSDPDTPYIQFGHWDSLKKGLLSGDRLMHALHRLDAAYINKNKRTLELTKNFSMAEMFPEQLMELITQKTTTLNLQELLYDMDYPGHYMRRIKSVAVTIPNVAGPNTTVSFMLKLNKAKVRLNTVCGDPEILNTGYIEEPLEDDSRFNYQTGGDMICTSSAQNDSGLFELNFGDERYLPFENAGAISQWGLSFSAGCDQFDLSTVSDVILHVKYTAMYDGVLAMKAKSALQEILPQKGRILFSMKHGFSAEWNQLNESCSEMIFELKTEHLPFFLRGKADVMNVSDIAMVLISKKNNLGGKTLTLGKGTSSNISLNLSNVPVPSGDLYLYNATASPQPAVPVKNNWTADFGEISPDDVEDIIIGFNLTEEE